MTTDQGHQTGSPFNEGGCRKFIPLFSVVAPLSAVTFWMAGWTASFWLEGIRRSNQEYVHADFGASALLSIFSPIVILIIIGIVWLILRRADMPRGYSIPIWITSVACVVALLTLAGESAVRLYFDGFLWLPATLLVVGIFYLYLLFHYRRSQLPPRRKRDCN